MIRAIPARGGIPPANRPRASKLGKLSSLRAAMGSGFVFIGSHQGPRAKIPEETDDFQPKVRTPNPQDAKARSIYEATIAARREQIKQLVLQLRDQDDEHLENEARILEDDLRRLEG